MVKYYVTMKKNEAFTYVLMWKRANEKSKLVFYNSCKCNSMSAFIEMHKICLEGFTDSSNIGCLEGEAGERD